MHFARAVTFGADLRQSLRLAARSPALTLTLVLTVAVGTGANAAIFAFVGGLVTNGMAGIDPADAFRFARVANLLFVACGLLLVLACATVAGLLWSRSTARTLETAVKVALGASRERLTQQCLCDSLVVTAIGGGLGVVFAWWTTRLFPMLFFAEDADALALTPNAGWLAAAALVWMAALGTSGVVPVLAVPQSDPASVLGARGGGRGFRQRQSASPRPRLARASSATRARGS